MYFQFYQKAIADIKAEWERFAEECETVYDERQEVEWEDLREYFFQMSLTEYELEAFLESSNISQEIKDEVQKFASLREEYWHNTIVYIPKSQGRDCEIAQAIHTFN